MPDFSKLDDPGVAMKEHAGQWLERIAKRISGEDEWRKEAEEAEAIYSGKKDWRFNILFSNVETIVPAIYNSTPSPDVRVTHPRKDRETYDHMSGLARIMEAAIAAQIDDNRMDTEIEKVARSAYLAGRGVPRVRFTADIERSVAPGINPETGERVMVEESRPVNEAVGYEVVPWRDFVFGLAVRWEDVPWVAFRHTVMPDEIEADKDFLAEQMQDATDGPDGEHTVWEVWDKEAREVCYIRADDRVLLKTVQDPLGLTGFFPVPEPLQPIGVTGSLMPVCPFSVYRRLAREVEELTQRIFKITEGMKVRGVSLAAISDLMSISDAEDNQLVTAQDAEGIMAMGGIDKAISWWPIDKAATVLRELYAAREAAKQQIYEVTGISDIVRGSSKASETATSQEIKNRWGSVRLSAMQTAVQRQVRDLFVMTAEIICKMFSPERLHEITGQRPDDQQIAFLRQGLKQYVIDVESDSTIRGDMDRAKGEMAQFMQGTAQFMQTMSPIAQQAGPEAVPPMLRLYAAFGRSFRLGRQADEAMDEMISLAQTAAEGAKDKGPSPQEQMAMMEKQLEIENKKAENLKMQRDMQRDDAKLQLESAKFQHTVRVDSAKHDLDVAKAQDAARGAQEQRDMDGIAKAAEIEIEVDQQRPVGIG